MATSRFSKAKKLDVSLFEAPKETSAKHTRKLNTCKVSQLSERVSKPLSHKDNNDDDSPPSDVSSSIIDEILKSRTSNKTSYKSPDYADELASTSSKSVMDVQYQETTVRPSMGLNISDDNELMENLDNNPDESSEDDFDGFEEVPTKEKESVYFIQPETAFKVDGISIDNASDKNKIGDISSLVSFDDNATPMVVEDTLEIVQNSTEFLRSCLEENYVIFFEHAPGIVYSKKKIEKIFCFSLLLQSRRKVYL